MICMDFKVERQNNSKVCSLFAVTKNVKAVTMVGSQTKSYKETGKATDNIATCKVATNMKKKMTITEGKTLEFCLVLYNLHGVMQCMQYKKV